MLKPLHKDMEYYLGNFQAAYMGYAAESAIREGAASGGVVSALLIHLLKQNEVDGALVSRIIFRDGRMTAETFIAKEQSDILAARTSIYFDFNLLRPEIMEVLHDFEGRLALVGLPCDLLRIRRRMAESPQLKKKIHLLIGLFCGHNSRKSLILQVLKKKGIAEKDLAAFTFRKGLWRGRSHFVLKDGTESSFPFQHFSHYQNLHVLAAAKCSACTDHTAESADISVGDIWLQSMKHLGIKHSVFMSRTPRGDEILSTALAGHSLLQARTVSPGFVFASNKRALIYHKAIAARARAARLFGKTLKIPANARKPRWNEFLAALIVYGIQYASENSRTQSSFFRLPCRLIWGTLATFKVLTNF